MRYSARVVSPCYRANRSKRSRPMIGPWAVGYGPQPAAEGGPVSAEIWPGRFARQYVPKVRIQKSGGSAMDGDTGVT
jgi:hypothetical protein